MKAILLAGGKGTRLRPLTIHTPKPIVPIFGRPFLHYQLDLLKKVPEIAEVVLSLNYQPRRIEEVFGHGDGLGLRINYVVEPQPLGTGGAIRYAAGTLDDTLVVFNGDVMTEVDLGAVIALHRERRAKATIVLTPVENPSSYGLVKTDPAGNVIDFCEKPKPEEIDCNTINAGIYILEPDTLARIPKETAWSVERSYFPSLVADHETFVAYIYDGYWIDIGTPEKYRQVHADIMSGRFHAIPFAGKPAGTALVSPDARVEEGAIVEGPCFVGPGAVVKSGARVGPFAVVGQECWLEEEALVEGGILWANTRLGRDAKVRNAILGRHCHVGRSASVGPAAVLGDKSAITDYSRL